MVRRALKDLGAYVAAAVKYREGNTLEKEHNPKTEFK